MKNSILIAIVLIFAAFSLFSCADGSQNTSNGPGISRNSLPSGNNNAANSAMNSNMTGGNMPTGANDNRMASSQDNFWTKAAQGGMAEVQFSQLALQKSQNAEVKNFAERMVTDHAKANNELKALAAKKNVTLPTEMDAAHQSRLNELKGMTGAEFDRAYVETMVADHQASVQLFENQADEKNDPDSSAFAQKTLPTLRMHLEAIQNIQGKMK